MKLWMKYNDIGGVNMPKKENPLRQLPVSSDGYGDIKIHLAEILEEKNISLNQLSFRTEMTGITRYSDWISTF